MDSQVEEPQMGMACRVCDVAKMSEEFPSDNLYAECAHAPLVCMRCLCKSSDSLKCPYPGCDLEPKTVAPGEGTAPWTPEEEPSKLAKSRIQQYEKILNYMFTTEPSGQSNKKARKNESIWIVSLSGSSFGISYKVVGNILGLKERVTKKLTRSMKFEDRTNMKIKLTFKGQELESYKGGKVGTPMSLEDYGIEKGSIIHLHQVLHTLNTTSLKQVKFQVKWPYTGMYTETELECQVATLTNAARNIHEDIIQKMQEKEELDALIKQLSDECLKAPRDFDKIDLKSAQVKKSKALQKDIEGLEKEFMIIEKTKTELVEEDRYTEYLDLSCIGLSKNSVAFKIDKSNRLLGTEKKQTQKGGKKLSSFIDFAIKHSGDTMNNDLERTGHQEMEINFDKIPPTTTHLVFMASAFVEAERDPERSGESRITLARFHNIEMSIFDSNGDRLCNTDIQHALAFTAVVLCILVRHGREWHVIESGMPCNGSILNYGPIEENIIDLIQQRQF